MDGWMDGLMDELMQFFSILPHLKFKHKIILTNSKRRGRRRYEDYII